MRGFRIPPTRDWALYGSFEPGYGLMCRLHSPPKTGIVVKATSYATGEGRGSMHYARFENKLYSGQSHTGALQ